MNTQSVPTYEELKRRLEAAESALTAIREGRVDTILGERVTPLKVHLAEAEETLARQLGFEQAVAAASSFLLSAKSSTAVVTDALTPLLEASGVSRVYIFENFDDPNDGLCMKQTFEVCAPGITPEIHNPVLQHVVYAQGFERWCQVLSAGDAIRGHVSDFPDDEREILEPQGILSILVLPIVVEGKWWGFIGFDETRQARDWHDSEVALLETAAEMIGVYFTRKWTEEALEREHAILNRTEAVAHVGSWQWEAEGDKVTWSEELFRIFGLEPMEEAPPFAEHQAFYVPEDRARLVKAVEECLQNSVPYDLEVRVTRSDGQLRHCVVRGIPERGADGAVKRLYGSLHDITERKQAEEALRESERRVRTKLNALLDPEGDIGTLHLADIVDCDEIQSLMNDFCALTDIGVGIIDLEGNVLVGTGWQDVCTKFHRVHPETAKRCRESDTALASGVEPGTFKIYKCKNNMWDMVTPIVIGEKHVGNLFLGQFFFDDEEPNLDVFREQARRYAFDEDAYLKAYRAIPRWSRETVDQVMTFYCNLIGVISRLSYAHIKLARTSETLRQSEQRFRNFFENLSAGSCLDEMIYENGRAVDYRILDVNPAYETIMGICREKAVGALGSQVYGLGEAPFLDKLERVAKTGVPERFEAFFAPIGKHLDFTVSRPGPGMFSTVFFDITAHKQAEQSLVQSEKKYRDIFDNSSDCIIIHDAATGAIVDVNRTTCETFGYSPDEIRQLDVGDLAPNRSPYTGAEAVEWIRKAHMEGPQRFEWCAKDRKGRLIWFESNLLYAQIGGKDRVLVFGSNIDERKRAEEELRRSEYILNQAQEIAHLGSYVWSIGDDGLEWSRQMFAIAGIHPEDFHENLQETVLNLIHPEDRDGVFEQIRQMLEQKRTWPMDFRLVRPDGDIRWLRSASRFEFDSQSQPVMCVGVHHDITEEKHREAEKEKLQSQLNQAQKMEAVGRLAGGVAHDFNNMLSVIHGNAEIALEDVDPSQPLHDNLLEIQKAAQRSTNVVRQLLAFARQQTIAPKVLDLNETVEEMLKMLRRLIGEDIDLSWQPGHDIWPVKMDPAQIDQILANLSVNARDAIAGVGKLTIETGKATFDASYCAEHPGFVPGDFVLLAVSDNGSGMDAETQKNLFEPFFTTKEVGQGTGLGLATVYGIAKQNNGFVNVYSEPDQGTTFKIYLPRHRTVDETTRPEIVDAEESHGSETILLVEDETTILKMTRMMLERLGYTVLTAVTPGEAMDVAREHSEEINLLMTDVVMPEMNGRDLAGKLLSLYPNLKWLFMSGYTANVIAHHGVLEEGVNFIQKPFSKQELSRHVRKALDEED